MTSTKSGVCRVSGCQRPAQPEAESGLCRVCADRYKRRSAMAAAAGDSLELSEFIARPAPKALGPKSAQPRPAPPPKRAAPGVTRNPAPPGKNPPLPPPKADLDAQLAAYIVTKTRWDEVAPAVQLRVAVLLMEAGQ